MGCFPVHQHECLSLPSANLSGTQQVLPWSQAKLRWKCGALSIWACFLHCSFWFQLFLLLFSTVLCLKWLIVPVWHLSDHFALKTWVLVQGKLSLLPAWGKAAWRLLFRGIGADKGVCWNVTKGRQSLQVTQQTVCIRISRRSPLLSIYQWPMHFLSVLSSDGKGQMSHPGISCLALELAFCLGYQSYIAGVHAHIKKGILYCVGMGLGFGLLWLQRAKKIIPFPVPNVLRLWTRGVDFILKEHFRW